MMDRKQRKLEQVRALLAKADGTPYEGEADVFRAKADALMTEYAIEEWQLAQEDGPAKIEPITREFEFGWYERHPQKDALWLMFKNVARHTRCKVAFRYGYGSGEAKIKVIGLPADLDYLDLLFTSLMFQMGKDLIPRPNVNRSFAENVRVMREAGMGWPEQAKMLLERDLIDTSAWEDVERIIDLEGREDAWKFMDGKQRHSLQAKCARTYRKHCEENGIPKNYVHPSVFQRSFAEGFTSEVSRKLRDMRREQEEAQDEDDNSMALAVRDIKQIIEDAAAEDDAFDRPKGRGISKEMKMDTGAYQAGSEAGSRADVSGHQGRRVGGRREQLSR